MESESVTWCVHLYVCIIDTHVYIHTYAHIYVNINMIEIMHMKQTHFKSKTLNGSRVGPSEEEEEELFSRLLNIFIYLICLSPCPGRHGK